MTDHGDEIPVERIAIVDDNEDELLWESTEVRRAGFRPVLITPERDSVDELVAQVCDSSQAVVCDNILQEGGCVSFDGAEVVARFFDLRFPAILVTQYIDGDSTSIQRWRRKIPIVLSKDEVGPASVRHGIRACLDELEDRVPAPRKPCRTIVRVSRLISSGSDQLVEAIVVGWNPHRAVRFPVSILPAELQSELVTGYRLIAKVNTDAERGIDLFFEDFERAPSAVPENLL